MDRARPLAPEFKKRARALKARHDAGDTTPPPPLTKDTPLTVPMSEWEKSDREGTCGNGRRFFLGPASKKYKERYDEIDWGN